MSLLVLAAALLVWPSRPPRRRVVHGPRRVVRIGSGRLPVIAAAAVVLATVLALGPAPAIAVTVVTATVFLRRRATTRRRADRAVTAALVGGVDTMVAELAVGADPAAACRAVARDHPGEVGSRFAAAAAHSELGGALSTGLTGAGEQGDSRLDWTRMASAWVICERHGLAPAVVLRSVRDDFDARVRFGRRTEASTAGARATATVLSVLPVLGIALGQAMGAAPLAVLSGDGAGGVLGVVGVTLVCAGLLWTDRIVAGVVR
ncbi:type II secretion system F family protein [Rhodococcus kroppenstedtii]|uniref:type II secretion system F family protein n=1 Tax=Rhodococcoides kroppenstedtii TaxID=293050 RepID=UPI001C9B6005|nr:type II secretion system F family protein [Rhodococcus kroppenstedtii]MBY6436395.1 type II secretion system F family protein [Rhodococcus kroppenstedtii]